MGPNPIWHGSLEERDSNRRKAVCVHSKKSHLWAEGRCLGKKPNLHLELPAPRTEMINFCSLRRSTCSNLCGSLSKQIHFSPYPHSWSSRVKRRSPWAHRAHLFFPSSWLPFCANCSAPCLAQSTEPFLTHTQHLDTTVYSLSRIWVASPFLRWENWGLKRIGNLSKSYSF